MGKTYYLTSAGTLSRKENTLSFQPQPTDDRPQPEPRRLPVESVADFFCLAPVELNTAALNFLGQRQIQLHCFDYYGNYTGSFMPRSYLQAGQVHLRQAEAHLAPERRLALAKRFVGGALGNMRRNLRYYNNREKSVTDQLELVQAAEAQLASPGAASADAGPPPADIPELMGLEGNTRLAYYEAWPAILEGRLRFDYRSKQPPHNGLNALISFANGLCYAECLRALHHTQLDPTISFLHEPGYRRFSLALDLAEIFKPLLADRLIFQLVNRGQIGPKAFSSEAGGVFLAEQARKTFARAWDERLETTIKHRSLGRKVAYRHLVRLEAYKLVKHLLGVADYQPFTIWW